MRRTFSARAEYDYEFFKEGIKWALRTGLDAMIHEDIAIALIAMISSGLYAGPHRYQINQDYEGLVNEILNESRGPAGEKRGRYFKRVVMCKLGA